MHYKIFSNKNLMLYFKQIFYVNHINFTYYYYFGLIFANTCNIQINFLCCITNPYKFFCYIK
jgi:hypothetical protein